MFLVRLPSSAAKYMGCPLAGEHSRKVARTVNLLATLLESLSAPTPKRRAFLPPFWGMTTKTIWRADGLRAVQVYSAVVSDCLWLLVDDDFDPDDGSPVYSIDEILELQNRGMKKLRDTHALKRCFPDYCLELTNLGDDT